MDEGLLYEYAFEGLDPFVRKVFSELMEQTEWVYVVDRNIALRRSSGSMKDGTRLTSVWLSI